jgi:hypothetical protein
VALKVVRVRAPAAALALARALAAVRAAAVVPVVAVAAARLTNNEIERAGLDRPFYFQGFALR